jgi:hypothetical protein
MLRSLWHIKRLFTPLKACGVVDILVGGKRSKQIPLPFYLRGESDPYQLNRRLCEAQNRSGSFAANLTTSSPQPIQHTNYSLPTNTYDRWKIKTEIQFQNN